jgi:hypothetical protein
MDDEWKKTYVMYSRSRDDSQLVIFSVINGLVGKLVSLLHALPKLASSTHASGTSHIRCTSS